MKKKIGVVHGRFQPLHLGHLNDYIMLAKEKCDYLYIGLTNNAPYIKIESKTNPHRLKRENNPLHYKERQNIIIDAMIDKGLKLDEFYIIPFPIEIPSAINNYVPDNATHYITIFDDWGREKKRNLENEHLNTKVLFEKPISDKKISSTMVRERLLKGKDWQSLVPESAARHVIDLNIKERLIDIVSSK